MGDYARLQAGTLYGYVTDAVFGQKGSLSAVLVTRDSSRAGGTVAFGFPGTTGRWNPRAGYYGLPYATFERAEAAALRVDPREFSG